MCDECRVEVSILFCSGGADGKGCQASICNDCVGDNFQPCAGCDSGVCKQHSVACSACGDTFCTYDSSCTEMEFCEFCNAPLCENCAAAGYVCQCAQGDGSKDNPIDLSDEEEEEASLEEGEEGSGGGAFDDDDDESEEDDDNGSADDNSDAASERCDDS